MFQALANGDDCARIAIHQMCEYLGFAMAQISCVIDPDLYLIGGGVAGSFDVFHDELVERFRAHCLPIQAGTPMIAATLGNQAGMFGSAYEALRGSKWRREED